MHDSIFAPTEETAFRKREDEFWRQREEDYRALCTLDINNEFPQYDSMVLAGKVDLAVNGYKQDVHAIKNGVRNLLKKGITVDEIASASSLGSRAIEIINEARY